MTAAATAIDPVTARWTGALFNLARRAGALDEVGRDLDRIAAELANPRVRAYLLGSRTSSEERRAKLDGLASGFHALTRNFVRHAFDRRREAVLAGAAEAFRRRTLAEGGVVEGVVESARPLDPSEVGSLETALGARVGKTVRLTQRVNHDLVAGVRVFVGARMIDQSAAGRLDEVRRRLEGARLPV